MIRALFSITLMLLLLGMSFPALAAITSTTPVVVIDEGHSTRASAATLANAAAAAGAGAKNGATVTTSELGNNVHKTTLTFAATPITVRDTEQGGGVKVYDFPEGRILVLGTTGSMRFTTTSALASTLNASSSSRWGLGTVTQANATLATTEQNLLPVTTFTSGATINVANTATTGALATDAQFDGTTTPLDVYLNVSVPGADDIDADATVTASGSVTITWVNLGDY